MRLNYNIIKLIVYIIGLCLTAYAIFKYGLIDSHTPPVGFVLPVFFMTIGFIWVIVDWLISCFFKTIKISYRTHYFGIGINLVIVFYILTFA